MPPSLPSCHVRASRSASSSEPEPPLHAPQLPRCLYLSCPRSHTSGQLTPFHPSCCSQRAGQGVRTPRGQAATSSSFDRSRMTFPAWSSHERLPTPRPTTMSSSPSTASSPRTPIRMVVTIRSRLGTGNGIDTRLIPRGRGGDCARAQVPSSWRIWYVNGQSVANARATHGQRARRWRPASRRMRARTGQRARGRRGS